MSTELQAEQPIEPLAFSIENAVHASGIGRSTLYNEIKAGELKILKVGNRTLIERDELRRWLATKRQAA